MFDQEAGAHGSRFGVVILNSRTEIEPEYWDHATAIYPQLADWDLDRPGRVLVEMLLAAEIPNLQLTDPFRAYYEETGERLYFELDGHFNETGHRLAAESIDVWLLESEPREP
jgi:hypothetical protein